MKYGLIGEKLGHSYSPQIHQELGCKDYGLIPLDERQFHKFMQEKDFCGLNVTIPYKEAVFPYCDEVSPKARAIGAINTVTLKRKENGETFLWGDNTDFDGFLYLLQQNKINLTGKTVMILGTGGTCKTVTTVAKYLNAKQIITVGRTAKNGVIDYDGCLKETHTQIIINTTPVGMYPNTEGSLIDLSNFPLLEAVVDVIFNPLETAFLRQGRKLGIPAINGLEMLVAQAKAAEEIFLQKKIADEKIAQIYKTLKKEIYNIVLIGMPGCGKSAIGKMLSTRLNKEFIDSDSLIEEKAGMKIADIFSQYGEAYFRKLEQETIAAIGKEHGKVIATGGGVIKNSANIDALKQNGIILFLDRPLEALETGKGRPLSVDREAVKKLYQERYSLYRAGCDIAIKNEDSLEHVIAEILAKWEAAL